jgi:ubiquinone/menaquinone biosynthesis C-methylase UbiE
MLREARRKLGETPGSTVVWLVVADASRLPFRDATFAWAAETLVFCEVPDPVAGLADVARVLRPGAPLVMLEHVRPGGWRGRVADLLTSVTGPCWGEHFDRDAAGAARQAGLAVERETWLWRDVVTLLETRVARGAHSATRSGVAEDVGSR